MTAPNGARLEVTILIDQDLYEELQQNGYSDQQIQKAIESSIRLTHTVGGAIVTPPVIDVEDVTLIKYY